MFGLFLNEVYSMKRTLRYYLLFLFVFYVPALCLGEKYPFNSNIDGFIIIFFTLMFVMNSFSYHKWPNWDLYANTFPVSKKQLTGLPYLIGMCGLAIGIIATGFFSYLRQGNEFLFSTSFLLTVGYSVIAFIILCITIPLLIQFGPEKGRILFVIVSFGIFGAISAIVQELNIQFQLGMSLIIFLVLILVLLFFLSFGISLFLYEKKEF